MAQYKDFCFTVGNDNEHEKLTAEISYQKSFLAMLTQEDGFDKLKLQLFSPTNPDTAIYSFLLDDFLTVVQQAKQRLAAVSGIEQDDV